MKNVQCGKRSLAFSIASIILIFCLTVVLWNHQNGADFKPYTLNAQHTRLSARNLAHAAPNTVVKTVKNPVKTVLSNTESSDSSQKEQWKVEWTNKKSVLEQHLPGALIIGAAKCGTEALKKFLALHPQVVTAKKEMCFFNNESIYEKGTYWYRQQMPYSRQGQITIEKSPSYFASRQAAARVHQLLPNMKLIVAVCDPIRRSLSDAHRIYATKLHRSFTADDFENEVIDDKTGQASDSSKILLRSVYILHLRKWLRFFDLSKIHIVDGEMLAKDPLTELKKTERYLQLSDYLSSEHLYFDEEKGFYCMKIRNQRRCLPKNKGRKHPEISPHVFRALKSYFEPKNEDFFNLVGRRFRWS